MEGTKYTTKASVLQRAQEAVGIPIGKIDKFERISTGKGAIGTVLEESWFGYPPNNESEPDFPEAGVELKATPYIRTRSGIRAKERLVITIINYMTEYKKTFYTSDFWHKSETILIMSYEHKPDVPKDDFTVDKAILFSFPDEDLIIIKQDWEKIISKIKAGEAHLISEGDTLYLAACTKGANAQTMRNQPFNTLPAKQRAYSLKSSYMTKILNSYIYGVDEDEHIIKSCEELEKNGFEESLIARLSAYYGKTQRQLKAIFGVSSNAKNLNEILLSKMLGVNGKVSRTHEFQNAGIIPKTIRLEYNGHMRESMNFPAFKFTEIIKEEWETSTLREMLAPTKFLFVVFRKNAEFEYALDKAMFWNMPIGDLEEVRIVWERTVSVIKNGVKLWKDGSKTRNNFPKQSESRVAHVRPHAADSKDTYPLPDGREMPKQCFWLNREYIESIVAEAPTQERYVYKEHQLGEVMAAEPKPVYGNADTTD